MISIATRTLLIALTIATVTLSAGAGALLRAQDGDTAAAGEGVVRVGRLVYAGGKTSKCFADGFLELADRHMESNVSRQFEGVDLASDEIFEFPFIIMTGEGAFSLSEKERKNLRSYIQRGGFLLASAGCSNQAWARSFRDAFSDVFADHELEELDTKHPMFHTLFDIDRIVATKGSARGALYGMSINGRLSIVFSPLGLNDTANAGGGCCCCGGNEVRNAKEINANILAYALTH